MSVSALIGSSSVGVIKVKSVVRSGGGVNANGVIECSSRPQKKATAHHMKTRPRKSAPWDVKRGPTVYPPLPPMPPEWTLLVAAPSDDAASAVAQAPSTPPEN